MITDTHTHLYLRDFESDIDLVIQRSLDLGIKNFFLPAIDSSHIKSMLSLKKRYPDLMHLMAGLHPCSVKENYIDELNHVKAILENQIDNQKITAIGEIGIDLYWDKSTLETQKIAFRNQIRLAKKYDLPIVIHCREAFDEIFEVLEMENHDKLRGIFHCFSGTYEQALKAISFNMKLGIGGIITFKNGKIDTFLNKISINNIVLETDSPYLAPDPYRGKRNESSYLPIIIKKLSDIYNISENEVSEVTTSNAFDIFKVLK